MIDGKISLLARVVTGDEGRRDAENLVGIETLPVLRDSFEGVLAVDADAEHWPVGLAEDFELEREDGEAILRPRAGGPDRPVDNAGRSFPSPEAAAPRGTSMLYFPRVSSSSGLGFRPPLGEARRGFKSHRDLGAGAV
ncbi:hypothetical protein Areg01_66130 [Actinoplanes regularis]|nr:hypothetical protein Areg01_66130 [Actinoplanes regularis]